MALAGLSEQGRNVTPTVESIQDRVEELLMSEGYGSIARSYILCREKRREMRMAASVLGLRDDLKLSLNTLEVLKKRYLLRDQGGQVIETPSELLRRVAFHVAQAERHFTSRYSADLAEDTFYRMMRSFEFLPNSPTLMNAGTPLGQLSACFVLPVEDSMDGIFMALQQMAKIHQTGGGTGFSFARLRPQGDMVCSTKGEASGPVSFMSIFDKATEVIVQGGRRRGANMGILNCDHPDIIEFIETKAGKNRFSNFNLSVGITDGFMEAVQKNRKYHLINPRNRKKVRAVSARAVFNLMVYAAWRCGDPGLIFLDTINKTNPLPALGRIEATNPCGELPLLPYESCNLGSINLAKMVKDSRIDWVKLQDCVSLAVRFLDDVIQINSFPLPRIREITLANRKIGLGVMGFADMLIKLGIPYTSRKAVSCAQSLMRFIHAKSLQASAALARERGVFSNYRHSIFYRKQLRPRNATVNTVAPTGTISLIAGCSSGIEPLFAISFVRNVLSGAKLFEVNPLFEEIARKRGFYTKETLSEIARHGSLQRTRGIPRDIKNLFVTAFDVTPYQHLLIQAAFQKHCDNAVSKTINLPADATVDDVRTIYRMAHRLRCKGITVYRYGCKDEQALSFCDGESMQPGHEGVLVAAAPDYSGGCAYSNCPL